MNLSIFQQTDPIAAGHTLVMAIYKASAPTVLISSYPLTGPYTGQTQLHTFINLQNVVYNYKLYDSPDGSVSGTVLNYFDIQPNQNSYNVRDDLYLVADTSPFFTSNTNFYGQDSSLIGWNWGLENVGGGTLQFGADYVKTKAGVTTTQDDLNADGFRFLAAGYLIGSGQKAVIHFLPQLAATSTVSSGTFITNTQRLTITTYLDASAAGQSFLLQGVVGYFAVNLPDINTVPDNQPIFFNSCGGAHVNVGLICFSGQQFEWYDNQSNLGSITRPSAIYLGQGENVYVYRYTYSDGSKRWQVMGDTASLRQVGETIYDYSKIPLNTIFADGRLLTRSNNIRLWNWVQTLESGLLIPESSWNNQTVINGVAYFNNWGKFSLGDGSSSFRIPLLYQYGYQRAKSGAAGAGTYNGFPGDFDPQSVGVHDHTTHGKGQINDSASSANPFWYLSNKNGGYSGVGGNLFGRKQSSPDADMRTGDNSNQNAYGENLPSSTGIYALIRT